MVDLGAQNEKMILLCDQSHVQAVFSVIVYQQEGVLGPQRLEHWTVSQI